MRTYVVNAICAVVALNPLAVLVSRWVALHLLAPIAPFWVFVLVFWSLTIIVNGAILGYVIHKSCLWDAKYGNLVPEEDEDDEEGDQPPFGGHPA